MTGQWQKDEKRDGNERGGEKGSRVIAFSQRSTVTRELLSHTCRFASKLASNEQPAKSKLARVTGKAFEK